MEVIVTCSNPPASQSAMKTIHLESGTVKALKFCGSYAVKSIVNTSSINTNTGIINNTDTGNSYLAHLGAKKDVYLAYIISSSNSTSSSAMKWKCRLHSDVSTSFVVSHCGCYVLAGNTQGCVLLWNSLGDLLSVTKAHYRSVTNLAFTSNGGFVISAGEDGICHMWNLAELCAMGDDQTSASAIHSWSEHHLAITSLYALPNNIMVSTSLDRLVVIMECCNGQTLARISLPSALNTSTSDPECKRIFIGAVNGDIYSIDLAAQAAKETAESANFLSQTNQERPVTSLKGHNRPVTAIAMAAGKLISGAENGEVRIWDLASRSSIKVLTPFASESLSENSSMCSISGILLNEVIDRKDDKLFSSKRKANIGQKELNYQPFQRFQKTSTDTELSNSRLLLPPKSLRNFNTTTVSLMRPSFIDCSRKKLKIPDQSTLSANNNTNEEMARLKEALAEAENKVIRWEKVNNKLATKLKKLTGK